MASTGVTGGNPGGGTGHAGGEEEDGGQPPEVHSLQQQQQQQPPGGGAGEAVEGTGEGSVSSPHQAGKPLNGHGGEGGGRRKGKCKWFNVLKGFGFITPHDGSQDIFVHQSVIQMTGFRSLGEGEEVEYECKPSDKGIEATYVSGPQSSDCKGSDRRPMGKKKYKKIRCYNCGDFGNHIAAKCPHGPLPKRCHYCKAENHLIADCPNRDQHSQTSGRSGSQRDSDSGADTPTGAGSSNGAGSGADDGGDEDGGAGNGGDSATSGTGGAPTATATAASTTS